MMSDDPQTLDARRDEQPKVRVCFMVRPVKDEAATVAEGHPVYRDVEYVEWAPIGTRDMVNCDTVDRVRRTRGDLWSRAGFSRQYAAWKEGREEPETGLPLKMWPPLVDHPGLLRSMVDCGVRTVEQLADVAEQDAARLGLGGRSMRDRARDWLAAANDVGKVTEEVAALRAQLRERDLALDELRAHVTELLADQGRAGRGRRVKAGGDADA